MHSWQAKKSFVQKRLEAGLSTSEPTTAVWIREPRDGLVSVMDFLFI